MKVWIIFRVVLSCHMGQPGITVEIYQADTQALCEQYADELVANCRRQTVDEAYAEARLIESAQSLHIDGAERSCQ